MTAYDRSVPVENCPRCGYGPLWGRRRPVRQKCPACLLRIVQPPHMGLS